MGERARRLGGECMVSQGDPNGTVVSLRVPLRLDPARIPMVDRA